MENALTLARPPSPILARHVAFATVQLLMALHCERFFGHPIDGFSADFNRQRAESNDRTVRAFAREAGQYAFFAGQPVELWCVTHPEAMSVQRISEAMTLGWMETAALLARPAVIDTVATEVVS